MRIILKPGREKSLRHRHPWVFSGAIEKVEGTPASGETVTVAARDGAFLAHAAYCGESQIRARVWSFDAGETIDEGFIGARLKAAIERRARLKDRGSAMRLVHGESDGVPGLIADRYGDTIVVQILSAGAERWRPLWAPALMDITGAKNVYERSDFEVRSLEGLTPRTGLLAGTANGPVRIDEDGIYYDVDIASGP